MSHGRNEERWAPTSELKESLLCLATAGILPVHSSTGWRRTGVSQQGSDQVPPVAGIAVLSMLLPMLGKFAFRAVGVRIVSTG